MIVAVDGTAASGKGTLAKCLAKKLKLKHLDTGMLYRIIGLGISQNYDRKINLEERALKLAKDLYLSKLECFDTDTLKSAEVGEMASLIAKMPKIRSELIKFQREFAKFDSELYNGAILDGRDIGSVILPKANFKFFLDAKIEIRAKRRTRELIKLGYKAIFDDVLNDIQNRDKRDKNRQIAPLIKTKDAIYIDSSDFSVNEMLKIALKAISGVKHYKN